MKNKIFFSIVTCTYNSDKYLRKNIDSVNAQKFREYEHIFIDAFSKDNTPEILQEYKRENPEKVKIFKYPARGIANAFNKGIVNSSGKYIIHLNSDDYLHDKAVLNDVYKFLIKNQECDWIYGIADILDSKNQKIGELPKQGIFKRASPYLLKFINYIPHQAVFIKKEVFDKFKTFNEEIKYITDYEYWLRISNNTNWIFFDRKISNYLARKESASLNKQDRIKIKKDTEVFHKKYCNKIEHRIFMLLNYSFLTNIYRDLRYFR